MMEVILRLHECWHRFGEPVKIIVTQFCTLCYTVCYEVLHAGVGMRLRASENGCFTVCYKVCYKVLHASVGSECASENSCCHGLSLSTTPTHCMVEHWSS